MTVAEVMIAALILLISSLAVLSLVNSATKSTFRAEQGQAVNNIVQNQLEQMKRVAYPGLSMTGVPTHSTDQANPNFRVSSSSFNLAHTGTSNPATMVTGGPAAIAPGPTPFSSGGVNGNVYRYVVWQNDPACSDSQCPGPNDYKKLVVAATINTTASGGVRAYREIQASVSDPDRTTPCPVAGCPIPGGPTDKPWSFWITDTPCDQTTRQPITADHLTHNTRGRCSDGLKNVNDCTGSSCTPGAPDLMYTAPAPIDNTLPDDQQEIFNYSTDTGTGKGLKLVNGPDCNTLHTLVGQIAGLGGPGNIIDLPSSNNFKRVHKWLAPPVPSGFDVLLSGTGTLNLWSKTAGSGTYDGKLCFWLFYRHTVAGAQVDTPVLFNNGSGGYTLNYYSCSSSVDQGPCDGNTDAGATTWPTNWKELHIPLSFQLGIHLLPNTQLGIAVGVDGTSTGADGLQFLYDQPSFDSRMEIQTPSTLPVF